MAKKNEVEPIIIEDEFPQPVAIDAEIPESIVAAIEGQAAKKAPPLAEVLAYWKPGREETMEVPQLIAQHSVKCQRCEALLPYIPVAGQSEPPVLVCEAH